MFGRRSKRNIETNIIFRDWGSSDPESQETESDSLRGKKRRFTPGSESEHKSCTARRSSPRLESKPESTSLSTGNDKAGQTLVDVLKNYGRYAFDLEGIEAEAIQNICYDWATHILQDELESNGSQYGETGKDWDGIEEFFSSHRRREQRYVQTTLKDFRSVLWDFIRELGRTMTEDKTDDSAIKGRLGKLKESVQTSSPRDLKREVIEVIQFIGKSIEQREQRQQAQMRQIGKRLRSMRAELVVVRKKMALDPLTQLFNRSALNEHLERVGQLCNFSGETACLYMLDTDHFKLINDNYGHPVGDAVLKSLADLCIRCFPRKADFVSRYGGDEFVIVVDGNTLSDCQELGRRLLEAVRSKLVIVGDHEINLTISVGVAVLEDGETPESWVARADDALRSAKQNGSDQIFFA